MNNDNNNNNNIVIGMYYSDFCFVIKASKTRSLVQLIVVTFPFYALRGVRDAVYTFSQTRKFQVCVLK